MLTDAHRTAPPVIRPHLVAGIRHQRQVSPHGGSQLGVAQPDLNPIHWHAAGQPVPGGGVPEGVGADVRPRRQIPGGDGGIGGGDHPAQRGARAGGQQRAGLLAARLPVAILGNGGGQVRVQGHQPLFAAFAAPHPQRRLVGVGGDVGLPDGQGFGHAQAGPPLQSDEQLGRRMRRVVEQGFDLRSGEISGHNGDVLYRRGKRTPGRRAAGLRGVIWNCPGMESLAAAVVVSAL